MIPKVSVIMPAYNSEKTIEEAIHSVLTQSVRSLELIVVNDRSTDDTLKVVSQLVKEDPRIILINCDTNQGPAEARNLALKHASGEYIAFLDSDDIWQKEKLEKQLTVLESTKYDICYTAYGILDGNSSLAKKLYLIPERIDYKELLKENVIGLSTVLIKRELLTGYKFNNRWFHEDYALWLQLLGSGKRAIGINEILVYYRSGGRSKNKILAAKNRWVIYRKAEKLPLLKAMYYMSIYSFRGIKKLCNNGKSKKYYLYDNQSQRFK